MEHDWNYTMIAIHMAGRSYQCGPRALQMQQVQEMHQDKKQWSDIGYHYGVDCQGVISEGRDIRFKGSHLYKFNTGAIGIVLLENMSDGDESPGTTGKLLNFMNSMGLQKGMGPPAPQLRALRNLICALREYFEIEVLGGHREFPRQESNEARLCPGRHGMSLVEDLRNWSGLDRPTRQVP